MIQTQPVRQEQERGMWFTEPRAFAKSDPPKDEGAKEDPQGIIGQLIKGDFTD